MKIVIRHSHRGAGCFVKTDEATRILLENLGLRALKMMQEQDPLLWANASDTGFLKVIKRGAYILRCIGVHALIPLTDANAHRAFVTCCLLALRIENLPKQDRRNVRLALLILAECCTVQIDRAIVPPLMWLPKKVRTASRPVLTYRKLLNHEPASLADLLRLLTKLENALTPSFVILGCELRKMTEGLRTALERTRDRRG